MHEKSLMIIDSDLCGPTIEIFSTDSEHEPCDDRVTALTAF